jgi:uncharacterized membrane protein (GlpM family)
MMYVALIAFYLFSIYFVTLRLPTLIETILCIIVAFIPYMNYIFAFLWLIDDVKYLGKAMIGAFDDA